MTKSTLTTVHPGQVECECEAPRIDSHGRVLFLRTCPVCMKAALDNVRGIVVSKCYEKGVSQRLVQKELFSFSPYSRSGTQEVTGKNGEPNKRPA